MTGEDPVQLESGTTLERMRTARAGTDRLLILASWDLLLDRMAAAVSADSQLASDIQQLRGFVDEQDLDAFHPLQRAELNPSLARRIRWFNQLIDDVLVQAVEKRWVSTRGFRATALWAGYWRNFRFVSDLDRRTSHKFSICVDLNLWAEAGDTPIWIWAEIEADPDRRLRDSDVTVSEDAGWLYVPVHLKPGVGVSACAGGCPTPSYAGSRRSSSPSAGCAYCVRMALVSLRLPDDLVEQARAADLDISGLARDAIRRVLDERAVNEWLDDLASLPSLGIDPAIVKEAVRAAKDEFGL